MKLRYVLALFIAIAMISGSALAQPPNNNNNNDGGWNKLTQENTLSAKTGYDVDGFFIWTDVEAGDIEQDATNCAAVMGAGNTVTQNNALTAKGILMEQTAENALMVIGTKNTVTQTNTALAVGADADAYGARVYQTQKNMLLVLGDSNKVDQTNKANGYNEIDPDLPYDIEQTAKNIAAVLGTKNDLDQTNTIDGFMDKCIEIDPILEQNAKNLAFMVGTSKDNSAKCEEVKYTAPDYQWPDVDAEIVSIPKVECEGCFELEGCDDGDCGGHGGPFGPGWWR